MSDFAKELDRATVRFERILPGPIERVWDYLYDSEKRREWFATGPMPAKVGETFTMHFSHKGYSPHPSVAPEKMREVDRHGHDSVHTLLACEPPTRLAYTFGKDGVSQVEFRLSREGDPKDNKVRLVLTHSRLPDRGFKLSISGGWHSHLDILEHKLRGETPPGFWDIWRKYDGAYDARYD
jgi:uncharacterized protein YndB with AHSA1/START domain